MSQQSTGRIGVSEPLRRFVEEAPFERRSILDFMRRAARELAPGSRVLDVGAGDAPYRELFSHTSYVTVDWQHSVHESLPSIDIQAPADAIPVEDESFDAVLLTQVLEHVPEPARVLAELARIARPGGRIFLTVPLVWELHEMPFDYYRYTPTALRHLLEQAGFADVEVEPRNDCFSTLAQLMRNVGQAMGRAPDGLDERRERAQQLLERLAAEVAELAPLDSQRILPLGYLAVATRHPAA